MSSSAVSFLQSDSSYRADPAHAQSHVKHILKSPAHYKAALKRKFSPTLRMQMGSALHCLILEGKEEFDRQYALKPDGLSLTTKEGKAWKEENQKKVALSKSDQYSSWDAVHGMAEALFELDAFDQSKPEYRKWNEVSLYWRAEGIDCKCRLDRLLLFDDHAVIVDIKTTDKVDYRKFSSKVVEDLNYLFQAAWYIDGVNHVFGVPASFLFIGIEPEAPHVISEFELSQDALTEGFRQVSYARSLISGCLKSGQWPRPEVKKHIIELPSYFRSPVPCDMIEVAPDVVLDAAFST